MRELISSAISRSRSEDESSASRECDLQVSEPGGPSEPVSPVSLVSQVSRGERGGGDHSCRRERPHDAGGGGGGRALSEADA